MTPLEKKALIALLRARTGELRSLELAGVGGLFVEQRRQELTALRTQLEDRLAA